MQKKTMAISALVAVLAIGSAGYTYDQHERKIRVREAKTSLQSEVICLVSLKHQVTAMLPNKNGFLPSGVSMDQVKKIEGQLRGIKDSATDFGIQKDELKNRLSVVKVSKTGVQQDLAKVRAKLKQETALNSLFTSPVIAGSNVSSQPINADVTAGTVKKTQATVLNGHDTSSQFYAAARKAIHSAQSQVKTIALAKKQLKKVANDKGVSLAEASKLKALIAKIQNPTVKQELTTQFAPIEKLAVANQKKAKALAEAKAKKTGGKVVKHADGSYTVSAPVSVASNNGSTSANEGVSSSSSTSSNGSHVTSSVTRTGSSNSSSSSSNSSQHVTTSGTSNGGSTEKKGTVENFTTVKSGKISNSDNTWQEGSAEQDNNPDDGGIEHNGKPFK